MAVSPRNEDLVAATLRGDERSFQTLVERHFGLVFIVGFSRLGDREMAEDLAQEVFLRAHLFLRELDPPQRFPAWVSRIARNLAIDWKRRGQIASRLLPMIPLEDAMDQAPDTASADPREQSAGQQEREIIQRAILDLPPAQREVILLHHCEELSQPEIAHRLGVNQSSVSRQLSAARARLRRALDPVLHETISALRPSRSAMARASMVAAASMGLSTAARASLVAAAGGAAAGKAAGSVKVAGAAWSLSAIAINLLAGVKAMGTAKGIAAVVAAAVIIGGGAIVMQGKDNGADDAPVLSAERGDATSAPVAPVSGPFVIEVGETVTLGDVSLKLNSLASDMAAFHLESTGGNGDPFGINIGILPGQSGVVAVGGEPPLPRLEWEITVHRIIDDSRVEVEFR